MAEKKYEFLVVKTDTTKKKLPQPWYKERLRNKYISDVKKERASVLNAKSWTFVKHGMDDFRTGLPPVEDGETVIKGIKGAYQPAIYQSKTETILPMKCSQKAKLTKTDIAYSKSLPGRKHRKDFVDDYEYDLTQHPLALYPHLEECMPPEVFEDVVDVLDPELNIEVQAEDDYDESDSNYRSQVDSNTASELSDDNVQTIRVPVITKETIDGPALVKSDGDNNKDFSGFKRHTYRWIGKKDDINATTEENANRTTLIDMPEEGQEAKIKQVTREFCDWVTMLGGETNNIEEATIFSLFASGYETKPALSVPIHVVELTNVPPELRSTANLANVTNEARGALIRTPPQREKVTKKSNYYGAWYLPTKLWKARTRTELEDPRKVKAKTTSETKVKSRELDHELSLMHGAKAFREFIDRKGTRLPEFLETVSIQRDFHDRDNLISKPGVDTSRAASANE